MRVLLTRLSALGDIVHTWPLAEALGGGPAPVELGWVVEEAFLPLVAGHPAVSRAIPVATRRWRRRPFDPATRREMGEARAAMRAFSPDVVVDSQGLVKSAVLGYLSGAPERVGLARSHRREALAGAWYTRTVAPPPEARHVVDVNLALATAVGRSASPGAAPDGRFLLRAAPAQEPPFGTGAVALLPATGGRGKAWSPESYAALARRVTEAGASVVVVWGPGERELAERVAAGAGDGTTLAPPSSIVALAVLLAGCAAVVGGDTGPVHLAASLGVPTVAVFVATDPERNGPRGARVSAASGALTGTRRGRARTRRNDEVTVTEVADALFALLERKGRLAE